MGFCLFQLTNQLRKKYIKNILHSVCMKSLLSNFSCFPVFKKICADIQTLIAWSIYESVNRILFFVNLRSFMLQCLSNKDLDQNSKL